MSHPKAYSPEYGYKYQILQWDSYAREWDHVDYAADRKERDYLMGEYHLVGGSYKSIMLPVKYWKAENQPAGWTGYENRKVAA